MDNVVCSNCGNSFGEEVEFCDSCGEWQGVNPTVDGDLKKANEAKRITTLTNEQLSGPISTYQSPPIPTRTQFPGVRAVVFLLVLIPLIAIASYWYDQEVNSNLVDTVIEEEESVLTTTSLSSEITTQPSTRVLQRLSKYISNCSASSEYSEGYSCSNLYDREINSWQDDSQSCKDGYVVFYFATPVELKNIAFQNLEEDKKFIRNWKVRELEYSTPKKEENDADYYYTHELSNDNVSQWITVPKTTTDELKIKFLSAYPGEEYNGQEAFDECAIQEIEVYGYLVSNDE